ncbi:MAG TPA: M48 family metallopeptidase [Terriglobia bacterium]|nr:M48 family metallopeptidase [Terriglobia bacterium]
MPAFLRRQPVSGTIWAARRAAGLAPVKAHVAELPSRVIASVELKPLNPKPRRREIVGLTTLALLVLSPVLLLAVEGLNFRPGFNLFSLAQDVEVGEQASQEAGKQLPLIHDSQVTAYVSSLGKRLARIAPNQSGETKYAWTFNVVNSSEINAFALPGGFIYVNRGAIAAAQSEAQIAGVLAHEEGHVVMRHGTHQASEMVLAQAPLSILAGLLGQSSSLASQLAQLGLTFGVNSILLRNSRSAESQADAVGTYVLYRAGYDPYALAQFFGILQQKYPQQTIQFFSDHPSPGNRIQNVKEEIPRLGPKKDWKTDSPEFVAVKQRLERMPPAPKPASQ